MALQFPSDPVTYPEYTYGDVTYVWDTDRWVVESSGSGSTPTLQEVTTAGSITTTGAEFGGTVKAGVFDLESLGELPE